ncbi:MAG: glycosyltransferase family 2 protein [Bosea sp.]|nr:glycosyltransferase family 2 protein [Bosea sp. (in: a-proteobacteria)]
MTGEATAQLPDERLGIVVIGRNEGERLVACLDSLGALAANAVYVDSGSSDGSVEMARAKGAAVVDLDLAKPFTASRARNAGFAALQERLPDLAFVQFVDGDCRLAAGWLDRAAAFLRGRDDVAVVFGRRRELHPERSVYNRMCDREWDVPIGEALECGGDTLIRAEAFRQVGGYADELIAGEEPDMCVRLRSAGWRIWRIDAEMTLHDAAMTRFGQWWLRSVRSGHAFAEVSRRHADSPFGIWKRSTSRALIWGLALPVAAILGAAWLHPALLLLLLAYPLQVARIALRSGGSKPESWLNAGFATLGKFPEMQGVARFYLSRLSGRRRKLIEYK